VLKRKNFKVVPHSQSSVRFLISYLTIIHALISIWCLKIPFYKITPVHSTPSHLMSLCNFNIILYPMFAAQVTPPVSYCYQNIYICPMCTTCPVHLVVLDLIILITFGHVQMLWAESFLFLRSGYSPFPFTVWYLTAVDPPPCILFCNLHTRQWDLYTSFCRGHSWDRGLMPAVVPVQYRTWEVGNWWNRQHWIFTDSHD
jgi:hypothetical protein